jgi:uncharacterized protein (UPF0332 family)
MKNLHSLIKLNCKPPHVLSIYQAKFRYETKALLFSKNIKSKNNK